MKFLNMPQLLAALSIFWVVVAGCKKKEDFTATKREVVILQKNWTESQQKLRETMQELKSNQEKTVKLNDQLKRAKELTRTKSQKEEVDKHISSSMRRLELLKNELDSLNQYMRNWNGHSKILNELIQDVKSETTTVAEADEAILKLRTFKALADPKLEHINQVMKRLNEESGEVEKYLTTRRK